MSTEKKPLSYGNYLKAIRRARDIGLREVSKETKIATETLALLENEVHDRLPAEVFVRGFLRAYATFLGLEYEDLLRRYQASLQAHRQMAKAEAARIRSGRQYWPRLIITLVVLAGIIAVSVFVVSDRPTPVSRQRTVQPTDNPPAVEAPATQPASKPAQDGPQKLVLKVLGRKATWLKIITDGQTPVEYRLNPGDRLELEARSDYNLLIGNAGGITLELNGNPVKVPGDDGQMVNLVIP
jgi:cytoskeleton protein RodZ